MVVFLSQKTFTVICHRTCGNLHSKPPWGSDASVSGTSCLMLGTFPLSRYLANQNSAKTRRNGHRKQEATGDSNHEHLTIMTVQPSIQPFIHPGPCAVVIDFEVIKCDPRPKSAWSGDRHRPTGTGTEPNCHDNGNEWQIPGLEERKYTLRTHRAGRKGHIEHNGPRCLCFVFVKTNNAGSNSRSTGKAGRE